MTSPDSSIDIPFHVPLVHRLRFTQDVLGDGQSVLVDLLQPSGHGPTRVQIWIDQHLQDAQPLLMTKIDAFSRDRARESIELGQLNWFPVAKRSRTISTYSSTCSR